MPQGRGLPDAGRATDRGARARRGPFARFALLLGGVVASASAPAAAPFEDTIAQRVVACTGCHGKEGRAAPDGYYPRIAGKPAGYLYNQLLHFRDGRRPVSYTHLTLPTN